MLFILALCSAPLYSHDKSKDSLKFDYDKIYSLCLDGDVRSALPYLNVDTSKSISAKDLGFKARFENRFNAAVGKVDSADSITTPIDGLLKIYRRYWYLSLLDNKINNDTLFLKDVSKFLAVNYPPAVNIIANEDSVDTYLKKYIASLGLFTPGAGKVGRLYDLLVWKAQKDTVYSFSLNEDKISSRVVFMTDFITLGWEEYATFGKYHPGGWATREALYCVRNVYDLKSEHFLYSYLAHESRHFSDLHLFPKLKSADLEYRAKLTELSMAQTTLYDTLDSFISNANFDSDNGHSVADFCIVRDLSKAIFNVAFEKSINKWKTISVDKINKEAYKILQANTKSLQRLGPNVERFIKN